MPNILNTDRGKYDLSNRMDVYRYFCREFGLKGDDMSLCERFFVTEYEAIESKLAKAREALEFYANEKDYHGYDPIIVSDNGDIAREALKEIE